MKLKLNENVCKCLALIVLSAIVGMVVYRQTQAKPVRSIETYVGTAAKDPSNLICILPKSGGGFVKCGVNLTDGTITTQISPSGSHDEVTAKNNKSGGSIKKLFNGVAAESLKVIPTENPLIKYVGPVNGAYIKVTFTNTGAQTAYTAGAAAAGVTLSKTDPATSKSKSSTNAYTNTVSVYYTLAWKAANTWVITKGGSSTPSITITTSGTIKNAYLLLCNNPGHEPNVIALFYPSTGPGQYSDNKFPSTNQTVKAQTLVHSGAPAAAAFEKYIDICAVKVHDNTILRALEPHPT
jgi:hypothetical protein